MIGPGGALEYGMPGPGGAVILVACAQDAAVPVADAMCPVAAVAVAMGWSVM